MIHSIARVFSVACVLLGCAACNANIPDVWRGQYLYEHELGAGAGGIVPIVEYELTVGDDDGCSLTIVGYQVDEAIICEAQADADRLVVSFVSFDDGSTQNVLGIQVYPVGEPLIVLIHEKSKLMTRWANVTPDGVSQNSGIFFVKSD